MDDLSLSSRSPSISTGRRKKKTEGDSLGRKRREREVCFFFFSCLPSFPPLHVIGKRKRSETRDQQAHWFLSFNLGVRARPPPLSLTCARDLQVWTQSK